MSQHIRNMSSVATMHWLHVRTPYKTSSNTSMLRETPFSPARTYTPVRFLPPPRSVSVQGFLPRLLWCLVFALPRRVTL